MRPLGATEVSEVASSLDHVLLSVLFKCGRSKQQIQAGENYGDAFPLTLKRKETGLRARDAGELWKGEKVRRHSFHQPPGGTEPANALSWKTFDLQR